jgi:hypothetical protein
MATGGYQVPGLNVDNVLSFVVNWNDAADLTAGTRARGVIPAGAHITGITVTIAVVFNAGTTNVVTLGGVSGTATNLVAAGDLDEGTAGTTVMAGSVYHAGALLIYNATADYPVYSKFAQTGTAATTGKAVVSITYAMPRATPGA